MYRDIYSQGTGNRVIQNEVIPQPGRLEECKLLETLIFVDSNGIVHVTLYDKRNDYRFFINRFSDIDSNVSRAQSIFTFHDEIVRLFRLNTHPEGFFQNVSQVAAYLIFYKRYPQKELRATFFRLLSTQQGNPRLSGSKAGPGSSFRLSPRNKFTETRFSILNRSSHVRLCPLRLWASSNARRLRPAPTANHARGPGLQSHASAGSAPTSSDTPVLQGGSIPTAPPPQYVAPAQQSVTSAPPPMHGPAPDAPLQLPTGPKWTTAEKASPAGHTPD
jgi:hypothetical protein